MPRGMTGARQLLAAWPIPRPEDWASRVNRAESKKELEALRRSVQRGQPYGSEPWCQRIVQRLGLESTLPPAAVPEKRLRSPENDYRPLFCPVHKCKQIALSPDYIDTHYYYHMNIEELH